MVAAVALFAVGTAISIFGQIEANKAQAEAEMENARWLDEQRKFAEAATEREQDIFARQADLQIGEQTAGLGASGFELSGTAIDILNESFRAASEEMAAIRLQGKMQVEEAALKAHAARANARRLNDPTSALLQGGGQVISGSANFIPRD